MFNIAVKNAFCAVLAQRHFTPDYGTDVFQPEYARFVWDMSRKVPADVNDLPEHTVRYAMSREGYTLTFTDEYGRLLFDPRKVSWQDWQASLLA